MVNDYFSPLANSITLLHLWSLGIEEQFYILFPLLIMLCRRIRMRATILVIGTLCILSLAASQVMVGVNPSGAFYLLPFRAFELLVGCLIALPNVKPPRNVAVATVTASVGVGALVVPLFAFDAETSFPGLAALLPCLSSAMIVWAGEYGTNAVSRFLATGPVTYIGRISYSLYLVHWPLIGCNIRPGVVELPLHRATVPIQAFSAIATADIQSRGILDRFDYFLVWMDHRKRRIWPRSRPEGKQGPGLFSLRLQISL